MIVVVPFSCCRYACVCFSNKHINETHVFTAETVFGNITNEHRALKEKYFSTRKQENNNRDGNAMGGGNGSGSGSNDRDDEGDERCNIYIYI